MQGEVEEHVQSFLRGYARVSIRALQFDSGRAADERIVERLVDIFRSSQGCLNDDPKHIIQVVLERNAALPLSDTISDAPILGGSGDHSFVCLHGKHRVLAGRRILPARRQWWLAQVYDRGECALHCSLVSSPETDRLNGITTALPQRHPTIECGDSYILARRDPEAHVARRESWRSCKGGTMEGVNGQVATRTVRPYDHIRRRQAKAML